MMKNNHLMNSYLYEAWKKAGLDDEDAKQAAIESARTDVAIGALNQSMTELRAHVDTSLTELRAHVDTSLTELRAHIDTSFAASQRDIANMRADLIEHVNQTSRSNLIILLTGLAIGIALNSTVMILLAQWLL